MNSEFANQKNLGYISKIPNDRIIFLIDFLFREPGSDQKPRSVLYGNNKRRLRMLNSIQIFIYSDTSIDALEIYKNYKKGDFAAINRYIFQSDKHNIQYNEILETLSYIPEIMQSIKFWEDFSDWYKDASDKEQPLAFIKGIPALCYQQKIRINKNDINDSSGRIENLSIAMKNITFDGIKLIDYLTGAIPY